MLKYLLNPNSKMSRKAYKAYLVIYSISFIVVGIIIFLTSSATVRDKYFGYGLGTGLVIGALLVLFRTLNERQFEKQYLNAFDERHQYIDALCFRIIYGLELLFLILIFLINLYNPLHLHFERVLI